MTNKKQIIAISGIFNLSSEIAKKSCMSNSSTYLYCEPKTRGKGKKKKKWESPYPQ